MFLANLGLLQFAESSRREETLVFPEKGACVGAPTPLAHVTVL
jgi:hypothetical protein